MKTMLDYGWYWARKAREGKADRNRRILRAHYRSGVQIAFRYY